MHFSLVFIPIFIYGFDVAQSLQYLNQYHVIREPRAYFEQITFQRIASACSARTELIEKRKRS
jgi:putrescine aminotransferase